VRSAVLGGFDQFDAQQIEVGRKEGGITAREDH
jgi:hypothetical protein